MSSNKGSSFEREISKDLSKWLTGQEKPYQYWRTPGSGSLCTIHNEDMGLSGDIRALTPEAKFLTDVFSIELKTGYPTTSFWQHFSDIKGFKLREFWEQTNRDAKKANKEPMLIYRKKGKKKLVGFRKNLLDNYMFRDCYDLDNIGIISIQFKIDYMLPVLAIMDFNDFFNIMKPDKMRSVCNIIIGDNNGEDDVNA